MKRKGLKINRLFTQAGADPLKTTPCEKRSCKITKTDGSVVFEMDDFEIPTLGRYGVRATDVVAIATRGGLKNTPVHLDEKQIEEILKARI